jgi:hypothetical protein
LKNFSNIVTKQAGVARAMSFAPCGGIGQTQDFAKGESLNGHSPLHNDIHACGDIGLED